MSSIFTLIFILLKTCMLNAAEEVPLAPTIMQTRCHPKSATIFWTSMEDFSAPILRYEIQSSTEFTPAIWKIVYSDVESYVTSHNVSTSPWANYTFRVIAWNKHGPSKPSLPSISCLSSPDVPYKSPSNVTAGCTKANYLMISWTKMSQIEHNGPRFHYKVYWKAEGLKFREVSIFNWKQNYFVTDEQPAYQKYVIRVTAENELGKANVAAHEVVNYYGENVPLRAPANLALVSVVSPVSVALSWDQITTAYVRGHFLGYVVKIWKESEIGFKEVFISRSSIKREAKSLNVTLEGFAPCLINYVQVYVVNMKYKGPLSSVLSFRMPEGVPDPVISLEVHQLGSSAFYLQWEKPHHTNGALTGYYTTFATVNELNVSSVIKTALCSADEQQTKVTGFVPNIKYRICVSAKTRSGTSKASCKDYELKDINSNVPAIPNFNYQVYFNGSEYRIKVTWLPSFRGNPGSHFFVQYNSKREINSTEISESEFDTLHITIPNLKLNQFYEFRVVAVDGQYQTKSEAQEVYVGPENSLKNCEGKSFP